MELGYPTCATSAIAADGTASANAQAAKTSPFLIRPPRFDGGEMIASVRVAVQAIRPMYTKVTPGCGAHTAKLTYTTVT
jgi:hypothetical protein